MSKRDTSVEQLQARLHIALDGLKRHLKQDPSPRSSQPVVGHDTSKRLAEVQKALENARDREEAYQLEITNLRRQLQIAQEGLLEKQHLLDHVRRDAESHMRARAEELSNRLAAIQRDLDGTNSVKDKRIADLERTVDMLNKAGLRQAEELVQRDARITDLNIQLASTQQPRYDTRPPADIHLPITESLLGDAVTARKPDMRRQGAYVHSARLNYDNLPMPPTLPPALNLNTLRPAVFEPPALPNRLPFPAPNFSGYNLNHHDIMSHL